MTVIYRRRVEFGLLVDPSTDITGSNLISTVHSMRTEFPEIGESIVWGQLRSRGIKGHSRVSQKSITSDRSLEQSIN